MDFARTLTARPWTVGPTDIRRLSDVGLSQPAIVLVIGLVAVFNYLTRVADGTGIEADYGSVLPQFAYRGVTESVPRPGPDGWPAVERSRGLLSLLPDVEATWDHWHDYLVEGPGPLPSATRQQLRRIAARAACDAALDPLESAGVAGSPPESGDTVAQVAEKLSLTPWLVTSSDIDSLRSRGMDDLSILHVIALVAYQSAESRLRIGLSALADFDEGSTAG